MLHKFLAQTNDSVAEIDSAYEAHDTEQLTFNAHSLKSSARMMGANALADLCLAMELASRNADWNEIDRLYPELKPIMEQLSNYIKGQ